MKILNIKALVIACALFTAYSCETDFLERLPVSDITSETFFTKTSDLQLYTNGFYRMLPATSIYNGDQITDNLIHNTLSDEMRGTRIVPTSGGGWSWSYLRDINYFLENYENGADEASLKHYGGVARFFRAWFYFEKVKRYGDVPWYEEVIDPDDMANLQKARDSRQFIVDKILEDLDIAIEGLYDAEGVYNVGKYTALALKSRVGLYEGTYEKYRGISGYEKYLQASVEASKELIENSPYSVYNTGSPEKDYQNLFSSLTAIDEEVIFSRAYSTDLAIDHSLNYYLLTSSYGMPGITKNFVNSYLNADGSRFTERNNYDQVFFSEEVKNRDLRLSQTIRTPGYTRIGSSEVLSPDLNVTTTGYQIIKYLTSPAYDSFDITVNDLPIFRLGEVLLNYAEAKSELGTLNQEDINASIKLLRDRVNMPNMNLSEANSNPDQFMKDLYPNVSGANEGIILEIRRERRIELFMENFRWNDIVRWKSGQTITQPLRGLYFPEGAGEYDLDANGAIDVVIYEGDKPSNSISGVKYLKLNSEIYLDENNLVDPHPTINDRSFVEPRDYLYPLPLIDLQLNPNLNQNLGWE